MCVYDTYVLKHRSARNFVASFHVRICLSDCFSTTEVPVNPTNTNVKQEEQQSSVNTRAKPLCSTEHADTGEGFL